MDVFFFFAYKLKQLKEVLYDGLDKMPSKDGKKQTDSTWNSVK